MGPLSFRWGGLLRVAHAKIEQLCWYTEHVVFLATLSSRALKRRMARLCRTPNKHRFGGEGCDNGGGGSDMCTKMLHIHIFVFIYTRISGIICESYKIVLNSIFMNNDRRVCVRLGTRQKNPTQHTNKHLHAHQWLRLFHYFLRFRVHPFRYAKHTTSVQTLTSEKFTRTSFKPGASMKREEYTFARDFEDDV